MGSIGEPVAGWRETGGGSLGYQEGQASSVNATSLNLDSVVVCICVGLQCIRVIRDECDHWGLSYQVHRGEMDRAHSTKYMPQLRMLDGRRPGSSSVTPACLRGIQTPLVLAEWRRLLKHHPDRE